MTRSHLKQALLVLCFLSLTAFSCSVASLADLAQQAMSDLFPGSAATLALPTVTATPASLDAAIRATIDANLQAAQNSDVTAYMAEIHPDSPLYASTESTMTTLFAQGYVLNYQIALGAATILDNGDASVSFDLTTTRISGPAFRDNEVTGTFILRLDGGEWKIYNQTIDNIRYLPSS